MGDEGGAVGELLGVGADFGVDGHAFGFAGIVGAGDGGYAVVLGDFSDGVGPVALGAFFGGEVAGGGVPAVEGLRFVFVGVGEDGDPVRGQFEFEGVGGAVGIFEGGEGLDQFLDRGLAQEDFGEGAFGVADFVAFAVEDERGDLSRRIGFEGDEGVAVFADAAGQAAAVQVPAEGVVVVGDQRGEAAFVVK